ncbi:uncharacterized membrane protein (UPF0127 family) [Pseudomonas sp. SORGH_AS199]|jgi:uncharacterized membrane protein (UPF0127 family)|uniref:DUF192 domain-containing protein n=2 Tax=Pseudomonas TaxID=286 RepID=A0ABT6IF45_9PSED|nr:MULTISPECIES: DUF192 domain-containing protein [Pseudomonas]MDH4763112.1 DUF192 domain-containing protein [Pseudomonas sp. CBMAI 2609]MDR6230510.1 uncharacterized membrane protein (UPF0127 family) [Pseudomonas sp. SORGH_AS_0199]QNQ99513.1 hypothetical protein BGI51_18680 [Pseudomonas psychrotolerans]
MTFFVHAREEAKRAPGPTWVGFLLLVAMPGWAAERIELRIGGQRLAVEVVATPAQRARGLMGRPPLGAREGMLFVFAGDDERCLWMRDTPSALAAAFIDKSGRILNTVEMQPLTDTHHCSKAPARYALETQAGWFSGRGIKPGEAVQGLETVAPASR